MGKFKKAQPKKSDAKKLKKTGKESSKPSNDLSEIHATQDDSSLITKPFWNIRETKDKFKIRVSAPCLNKKNIKVKVEGSLLTISCSNESKKEEDKKAYVIKEYNFNSWSRSIILPAPVNAKKKKLYYEDGILKLDIPKSSGRELKKSKSLAVPGLKRDKK